jgi:hypothetical protein
VRNITIAIDEEVYRRARIRAAQADTSISALVRDFLVKLGSEEDTHARLKELQNKTLRKIRKFRASDRLSRAAAHER